MSATAGSIARLGLVGLGAITIATLGLIVPAAADVVGCAHATHASADSAEIVMHETDCASVTNVVADAASMDESAAASASAVDAATDAATISQASADSCLIVVEAC